MFECKSSAPAMCDVQDHHDVMNVNVMLQALAGEEVIFFFYLLGGGKAKVNFVCSILCTALWGEESEIAI